MPNCGFMRFFIKRNRSIASDCDFLYSHTVLRSVVCLSVCRVSVVCHVRARCLNIASGCQMGWECLTPRGRKFGVDRT